MRVHSLFGGLMAGVLVLCSACGMKVPQQSQLTESIEAADISAFELRIKLVDFTIRFARVVELAADEIARSSDSREVRQNTLAWKIHAIPALQQAAFTADGLAALIDCWGLCMQMRMYFEEGDGKDLFGEQQQIAVLASKGLEREIRRIAVSVAVDGDVSGAEAKILAWAREHPLDNPRFVRISTIPWTSELFKKQDAKLTSELGSVSRVMGDLSSKIDIYMAHLPKQVQWQVEYLLIESLEKEKLDLILEPVSHTIDSLVDETMKEIDRQRMDLVRTLQNERAGITQDLKTEREIILAEIDRQRTESIAELQSTTDETLEKLSRDVETLIDHTFLRIIQVIAILVGVAILAVLFFRWRRPSRG